MLSLPNTIKNKIIQCLLNTFSTENSEHFYKYFFGLISLVSKDWYHSIVKSLVIKEFYIDNLQILIDKEITSIKYLHYLLKRGIVVETLKVGEFSNQNTKNHDGLLSDIITLWRDNMGISKSLLNLSTTENGTTLVNVLGFERDLFQFVSSEMSVRIFSFNTHDTIVKIGDLSEIDITEINQNQNHYKKLSIKSLRTMVNSILLEPRNLVSIKMHSIIYMQEYIYILLNNPVLLRLQLHCKFAKKDQPHILENITTLLVPELIGHKSLEDVYLSAIGDNYIQESLENLVAYLNGNSIAQKLTINIDNDQLEMIDLLDIEKMKNYRIGNSSLRELVLLNDNDFINSIFNLWVCESKLENLTNYSFETIPTSLYPTIIQYHKNITTLQCITFPGKSTNVQSLCELIQHLDKVKRIKLNVSGKEISPMNCKPIIDAISSRKNLSSLTILETNLESNVNCTFSKLILSMPSHPSLKSLELHTNELTDDLVDVICKSTMIQNLILFAGPPLPIHFRVLNNCKNLVSFKSLFNAKVKNEYPRNYLDDEIKQYYTTNKDAILPDKLILGYGKYSKGGLWNNYVKNLK
ncbi:hypothetical protein DLAC_04153 [Tieghemostelium lacteum]|uniref:Uncharacterized protein n=1 Tax=Tieghemostelium lacteum TaxID=361077 RepID=A0A151ZS92_TIELA|nr:hypothetical protein DLAC_04153 [Tieghemostelium lacteum]|eukprot:KYQ96847.1 hypothetical protein DLAC_04153 [Tieghemostelium lacteum]